MFRVEHTLNRVSRNFDVTAPDSIDVMYADRQLMLAGQYIDQARVALELIRQHWVAEGSFAGDTDDVVAPIEDEAVNPTLIAKGGA